MILVDASVLIDYFRSRDAKLLSHLQSFDGAVCGITRAELLHGTRDPKHRQSLIAALNAFHQVAIPDPLWDTVGDTLAALRAGGVTVPFADAALATVAFAAGLELWARDQQFEHIQRILPQLKLFREPP
jgi:predicted nucleic acid-binding protein